MSRINLNNTLAKDPALSVEVVVRLLLTDILGTVTPEGEAKLMTGVLRAHGYKLT